MELRVRSAHEDGLRTSEIIKYGSQNLNFPPEMGNFMACNGKFVDFSISNVGFLSFLL